MPSSLIICIIRLDKLTRVSLVTLVSTNLFNIFSLVATLNGALHVYQITLDLQYDMTDLNLPLFCRGNSL